MFFPMKKKSFSFFLFTVALVSIVLISACDNFEEPELPKINDLSFSLVNNEDIPLSNVWVKVYFADVKPGFVVDSTLTSVAGSGSFKSLRPGSYLLKAFDDSNAELGATEVVVQEDDTQNVLAWKLDVFVENYNFLVKLMDNRQHPISGRKVSFFTTDLNPVLIAEGSTNSQGELTFSKTVVGSYRIVVYDETNEAIFAEEVVAVNAAAPKSKTFVIQKIFHNGDMVITGYFPDPKGSDSPKTGAVSGAGFEHPGQYEYVQLMALRDIDFTKEPYSVVVTNSSIPAHWGMGLDDPTTKRVYQMNFETGSVKKGEFFYIGGSAGMIASYWQDYGSPLFDEDKYWKVDYAAEPGGNGNGAAKDGSGLMGNGSGAIGLLANSKGYPDGVAVFKGTHVDANSTPIDVIFYGTTMNFDLEVVKLRITDTDRYSTVNPETDEDQSLFGQGTNIYLFPVPKQDDGVFIKLGGQVTPTEWLVPRSGTPLLFNLSAHPAASVSDIENANDCTIFVDK